MKWSWCCCLVAALSVGGVEAQERPFRFELTPYAGYRVSSDLETEDAASGDEVDLDLDETGSFGLILNIPADYPTEWEFLVSRQSTEIRRSDGILAVSDPLADLDITYLQAGGTYLFEGERARPYFVATLGAAHFDPDGEGLDSETFFAFSFGGGVKLAPTSRIGLRLEARAFATLVDSDTAVYCESGPEASGCRLFTRGSLLWQWELNAGLITRF